MPDLIVATRASQEAPPKGKWATGSGTGALSSSDVRVPRSERRKQHPRSASHRHTKTVCVCVASLRGDAHI
eukprot:4047127-Pyramimonas_sp.AAC.1